MTFQPKNERGIDTNEKIAKVVRYRPYSKIFANVGELENKFPFALGVVCGNLSTLDKQYRKVHGLEEQGEFSSFFLDVEEDFPLADRFAYPCVLFVSSMMLIDVDNEVSDAYYEKYADIVSKIVLEIPFENGSTAEKYPY